MGIETESQMDPKSHLSPRAMNEDVGMPVK